MSADASQRKPAAARAGRVAGVYGWLATTLLTTVLLFAGLNGVAALLLAAGVGVLAAGPLRDGLEPLRAAYPGRSDQEIRQLLTEVWTRPYIYEPFTKFREGAFAGRYLHILAAGFRSGGHPQPWPPSPGDRVVFVFGGSTAMGYGVADDETLPAQLELALGRTSCGPAAVYNFARSNYFSSQERILFEQLALAGAVPEVAIFVDGLNEFAFPGGEPKFTTRLSYFMSETQAQLARRWFVHLPLARLIKGLRGNAETVGEETALDEDSTRVVVERWLRNRALIEAVGRELSVATIFVWQPIRVAYEARRVAGYALLDELRRRPDLRLAAPGFLWLADAHPAGQDPLYVDRVHYSAAFNRYLAERLAPTVRAALCPAGTGSTPGAETRP